MIRKLLLILLLLPIFQFVEAQIYNTHNFYTQNMFYYSPAHTGDKEQFAAFLNYRDHLSQLTDATQSAVVGFHSPITERMNLGTLIKTERIGLFETFSARLDYSFRAKISDNQLLAFGINGGILQRNINFDNAYVRDLNDPTLAPGLAKSYLSFAGASINYQLKNFSIDLAIPVLYRSGDLTVMNYFTFFSYSFFTNSKKWMVQPSGVINYVPGRIINYHANVLFNYDNVFWFQPTYKANRSLCFSAGVNLKKIGIAYAYETNSGALAVIGGPSHEIMLTYGFFKRKSSLSDTINTDPDYAHNLKRKIGDKTYEEYVSSNNYGFYNSIIDLTDSIHKEEIRIESLKNNARNDSLLIAQNDSIRRAYEDSVNEAKRDSIRRHTLRHLTDENLKLLEDGVHFDLGSAMINSESRIYLDKVAVLLKSNINIKILVSGHTCDLGTEEANLRFSQDRAEAVKYYLLRKGVNSNSISSDARLDAEPVVPNINEQNRSLNRRVSFSVIRE